MRTSDPDPASILGREVVHDQAKGSKSEFFNFKLLRL